MYIISLILSDWTNDAFKTNALRGGLAGCSENYKKRNKNINCLHLDIYTVTLV